MFTFFSRAIIIKRRYVVNYLFTIISLTLFPSCAKKVLIPSGFIESKAPRVGTKEWSALANSKALGVTFFNGKLEVKETTEVNRYNLPFANGTLLGINNGEWGGSLTFKPDDSTKNVIKIKDGNINWIFYFQNKPYFMEGLAHMGYSVGAMFEIDTSGNKFSYKKLVDFKDAPEAFAISNGTFFIACHKSFYLVRNFEKELIFKDTFWQSLYPNSIVVIDDKNVFLGIRGGIVRLNLIEKTMRFYKYGG